MDFDKIQYNNQYNKGKYDRVTIMLDKGDRDIIRDWATRAGESVNGYIKEAIRRRIIQDAAQDAQAAQDGRTD